MSNIQSICVYCSARNVAPIYQESIKALGEWIGESGRTLVYGGSRSGLMGMIADSTLNHGGQAIGIIPHHIQDLEIMHEGLSEQHVVDTMHERKQMMIEKSDAFIAMPGGFGTLEEFLEVLTWKQLKLHDYPIVLANINGYWDPLIDMLNKAIDNRFAEKENKDLFRVITDTHEIEGALLSQPRERHSAHKELL